MINTEQRRRPTVPEVMPLVRTYQKVAGNEVGGSLHIVLGDGNVRDGDVEFCYRWAMRDPEVYNSAIIRFQPDPPDYLGAALALVLMTMSRTQRSKVVKRLHDDG